MRQFTREEYPEAWDSLLSERRTLRRSAVRAAIPAVLGVGLAWWFAVQHPAVWWGRGVCIGVACAFALGSVLLMWEAVHCVRASRSLRLDLNEAAAQGASFMEVCEFEASRAWDCGGEHHDAVLFQVGTDEFVWVAWEDWLDHLPSHEDGPRTIASKWFMEVRGDFIWTCESRGGPRIPLEAVESERANATWEVGWRFCIYRREKLPEELAAIVSA